MPLFERLHEAFDFHPRGPDTKVYANQGTPYPGVTQHQIDILQDRHRRRHHLPRQSMRSAAYKLEDAHARGVHLTPEQVAALDRLTALSQVGRWGPDVVIKTFDDLDLVFFRGKLRGNIYLRWTSPQPTSSERRDQRHSLGTTWSYRSLAGCPRIAIELSSEILTRQEMSLRDVWSTLLHEMCHAYLGHLNDYCEDDKDDDMSNPGHGRYFQKCIRAVQSRLGGSRWIRLDITMERRLPIRRPGAFVPVEAPGRQSR
ncbi:MAG: hypothetical protein M1827_001728 [Pycnora praestabilis]|nr:MAG: hypothetical protein M1827_001728 [Pycnora praestabilis]